MTKHGEGLKAMIQRKHDLHRELEELEEKIHQKQRADAFRRSELRKASELKEEVKTK